MNANDLDQTRIAVWRLVSTRRIWDPIRGEDKPEGAHVDERAVSGMQHEQIGCRLAELGGG